MTWLENDSDELEFGLHAMLAGKSPMVCTESAGTRESWLRTMANILPMYDPSWPEEQRTQWWAMLVKLTNERC
jgi:hypothetical protein